VALSERFLMPMIASLLNKGRRDDWPVAEPRRRKGAE